MADVKVDSPAKPNKKSISESDKSDKKVKSQVKPTNNKTITKNVKQDKFDDSTVEKEFLGFIAKLRSKYPGNSLAYQLNNYPEVGYYLYFLCLQDCTT